ncbi:hypothetical protein CLI_1842 [Clostridium botulinum F str. Langeland]|uniref:Uncharacterized protein n=1 Tax=Clostridium botulinum (strain Langeland / NCTC 10281 / Type F) TaxID=441772 RepID=A7GE92_CLOBL|nr:hypothetical protein CLI_1842 [Clostridium botulinum F str. Langeland]
MKFRVLIKRSDIFLNFYSTESNVFEYTIYGDKIFILIELLCLFL